MMAKSIISTFLFLCILLALISSANAASTLYLQMLSDCRRVYGYSGSAHAYFYGYTNNTLVSARVLPDTVTRSAVVSGVIRAVCHDERNAYALYEAGRHRYGVVTLNMDNGSVTDNALPLSQELITTSFAACDGESFVMGAGSAYVYVLGIRGGNTVRYEVPSGAERLFVNGGSAYALSFQGGVYRLRNGTSSLCLQLTPHAKLTNAGDGWLLTASGELVSLSGSKETVQGAAVKTSAGTFSTGEPVTAVVGVESTAAVLTNDSCCSFCPIGAKAPDENADTPQQSNPSAPISLDRISPGVTVAQLKQRCPGIAAVYDAAGEEVRSGAVRTGYAAALSDERVMLSVTGDLNGSGTVNHADVKRLMQTLANEETLAEHVQRAADVNNDGTADNRDLVLLAQSATYH